MIAITAEQALIPIWSLAYQPMLEESGGSRQMNNPQWLRTGEPEGNVRVHDGGGRPPNYTVNTAVDGIVSVGQRSFSTCA